jgi:hypothetical protein
MASRETAKGKSSMSVEPTTAMTNVTTREVMNELHPGDRVEVVHEVKVGMRTWTTKTVGEVVSIERRRHGLHFRRNIDDKAFSDLVVLKLDDGSLTTVTMDEFSTLRKLS